MAQSLDLRGISRREFLRLSSAALLALLAAGKELPTDVHAQSLQESLSSLGRITTNRVDMFDKPSLEGKFIRTLWKDLVLPISNIEIGKGEPVHNKVWYRLNDEGYVHSGTVQPVQINLNEAVKTIPEKGFLAEVTVPFTDALWNPRFPKQVAYRLYFTSTHWVTDLVEDDNGGLWYEVLEDFYQFHYFVNATHLRIIQPAEVEMISPEVPAKDKKIEVHLNDQIVIAYEGSNPVQMMRCSGGTALRRGYLTPTGEFRTDYKRPSRHMVNSRLASAYSYDLPGVPWICYFTEEGIAFHGTYWHNDFGRPKSHGCINLLSENAKWLYRWTLPHVPYEEQRFDKIGGTAVKIVL